MLLILHLLKDCHRIGAIFLTLGQGMDVPLYQGASRSCLVCLEYHESHFGAMAALCSWLPIIRLQSKDPLYACPRPRRG